MQILKRESLQEGGFAGLKEHQLVKDSKAFGPQANTDGSWSGKIGDADLGKGNFIYLADARFMPHGETGMHSHHEVDVISVLVDGNIAHEGSLEHGQDLSRDQVQVQRAGGEGFSHNEINPQADWNRMLQLWVLPEVAGQPAAYKVTQPVAGELTRIYGGDANTDADFPAKTKIDIAILSNGQQIEINQPVLAYLSRGKGSLNNTDVEDGDLIRANSIKFEATEDVQLIIIYGG